MKKGQKKTVMSKAALSVLFATPAHQDPSIPPISKVSPYRSQKKEAPENQVFDPAKPPRIPINYPKRLRQFVPEIQTASAERLREIIDEVEADPDQRSYKRLIRKFAENMLVYREGTDNENDPVNQ